MNRLLMVLLVLGSSIGGVSACDICGCSIQGGAFGILPQFHTNFIGLRWQMAQFYYPEYATSDQLHQAEVWARIYPVKRIQLLASIPYRFHQRVSEADHQSLRGWGDASLMTNISIYSTPDSVKKKFNQTLFVGGGIKLPTAQLQNRQAEDLPANFQLGTGSWDGIFTLQYQARVRNWGFSPQVLYKRNSENQQAYRFGDQLLTSIYTYYWTSGLWWMWMPYGGLSAEWIGRDVRQNYFQNHTGGQGVYLVAGSEWYTKHLTIGASYQHPVRQSYAQGAIEARPRASVQISFIF